MTDVWGWGNEPVDVENSIRVAFIYNIAEIMFSTAEIWT